MPWTDWGTPVAIDMLFGQVKLGTLPWATLLKPVRTKRATFGRIPSARPRSKYAGSPPSMQTATTGRSGQRYAIPFSSTAVCDMSRPSPGRSVQLEPGVWARIERVRSAVHPLAVKHRRKIARELVERVACAPLDHALAQGGELAGDLDMAVEGETGPPGIVPRHGDRERNPHGAAQGGVTPRRRDGQALRGRGLDQDLQGDRDAERSHAFADGRAVASALIDLLDVAAPRNASGKGGDVPEALPDDPRRRRQLDDPMELTHKESLFWSAEPGRRLHAVSCHLLQNAGKLRLVGGNGEKLNDLAHPGRVVGAEAGRGDLPEIGRDDDLDLA